MSSLTPLDLRYDAQSRAVWTTVLAQLARSWTLLGSWRSPADITRFQRTAIPALIAGERTIATLTTTYLERLYRDIAGESSRVALDMSQVTGTALRGVDPSTVYARPFNEVWTALSNGESLDVALQRGENRLSATAKTDLQLARTHTARAVTDQQPGVEYTIREPVGEKTCALCLIASTQRYRKKNLLPIHPGCDCLVKTVKSGYDPGLIIDSARLEAIHAAIEAAGMQSSRSGDVRGRRANGSTIRGYQDLIIAHEHGEIGPVLGIRGQKFTGPRDIRIPS